AGRGPGLQPGSPSSSPRSSSASPSARSRSAWATWSARRSRTCRSSGCVRTCLHRSRRCSGSCACPASCSGCLSGRCCRPQARPTRASSATRSSTRTSSASRPAPASASLALAGVTVTAFLTAIQTFVQQQHSDTLQTVYSWILGSLDTAGWHDVLLLLPYACVSAAVLLLHRRVLDVMVLGDDEAASLGLDVARVRLLLVAGATLGTAAAVAVSGLIGFLGIIVPHFVRLVAGGSYRIVLPLSLLVGGGFLALADVL